MLKTIQTVYYSCLFYGGVFLLPYSPGTLAWKLFKNKKGKIPLIKRDLVCDTQTLMSMPKSDCSLDEFTTAFSPFIPLLTLNAQPWKQRRKILSDGLRKMHLPADFTWSFPQKKGDIYWDLFEGLFRVGFELIFGRPASDSDYNEMYPGILDINRLIKRQSGVADFDSRWKLYNHVVKLLAEKNEQFIFAENPEFKTLSEIAQVSIIVEDLLTSICIQCTDLICHLILLYPAFQESFKTNLDQCIDETLRLYPLTDIWTRKSTNNERGWIASLVQLNRNGWNDPDHFLPERWGQKEHPPLISWGFDARGCPATKIGLNLTKSIFQKLLDGNFWVQPASNYTHDRTFCLGCQVWIGTGEKPANVAWNFEGKCKTQLEQWFNTRLRLFDQGELW